MGRFSDDRADIGNNGAKAVKKLPFADAVEKPEAKPAGHSEETKADGHKFCRYSDGSEGAMVRGLQFKSK